MAVAAPLAARCAPGGRGVLHGAASTAGEAGPQQRSRLCSVPCLPALRRAELNRACSGSSRTRAGRAAPATLPWAPGTSAGAPRPHPLLNAALCGTAAARAARCSSAGRVGVRGCCCCQLRWVTPGSLGGQQGSNCPELALPCPSRLTAVGQR